MSAPQTAGMVLNFPSGQQHIAIPPSNDALLTQAKDWHELAQTHHLGARVSIARGDWDAALKHLVHEHGKIVQVIAIMKEVRGLPRGKRARELEALQLVLSAVHDDLTFLRGTSPEETARHIEATAERVDHVQARLLNLADGIRSSARAELDESTE